MGTLVWDRRKKRQHSSKESFPPVRVEGAWAGMIDQRTFNVARKKLASRAPLITHPRVVNSQYILTGMIRCKGCGTAMTGMSAKSGRFLYYVCNNKRRTGKGLCKTPLLPKQKMESFVFERIRDNILTAETLKELTRLVNEEIYQYKHENEEELSLIQSQIDDVDGRLGKLYDALETGSIQSVQLAPRVEALTEKKARLEQWKADTEAKSLHQVLELASTDVIDAYVNDLRALLEESSIMELKAFLRSFIQSLEVAETDLTITYTIPIDSPNCGEGVTEVAAVLPTIKTGSPGRIRTYDLAVNSHHDENRTRDRRPPLQGTGRSPPMSLPSGTRLTSLWCVLAQPPAAIVFPSEAHLLSFLSGSLTTNRLAYVMVPISAGHSSARCWSSSSGSILPQASFNAKSFRSKHINIMIVSGCDKRGLFQSISDPCSKIHAKCACLDSTNSSTTPPKPLYLRFGEYRFQCTKNV